jgi:hypothetical protein
MNDNPILKYILIVVALGFVIMFGLTIRYVSQGTNIGEHPSGGALMNAVFKQRAEWVDNCLIQSKLSEFANFTPDKVELIKSCTAAGLSIYPDQDWAAIGSKETIK